MRTFAEKIIDFNTHLAYSGELQYKHKEKQKYIEKYIHYLTEG